MGEGSSSVGTQLQQARTERKRSLADVTQATKIQPWVLEALEADRLQDLMSPIYAKGFLASYAKFLHLDPVPLVAQLRWPQPESTQAPVPPPSVPFPAAFRWPLPLARRVGVMAAVGAVALLLAINPLKKVSQGPLPTLGAPKVASVTALSAPAATKAAELPTLTLLATQPLELALTAHRSTWVQVRADGKLLAQQRLQRGVREQWTAKKQFELIVSQPSQVELTLNGHPISPFAVAHRGRLLITHRGVIKLPEKP